MRWTVHGERSLYESEWVCVGLADVELADGTRFDHHVVRFPQKSAGVVVHDQRRGILLLYRHRFISDTWGWEIPAGKINPGETVEQAAAREVLEETGWRPGPLRRLVTYHPASGLTDAMFNLFLAQGAERVGEPEDAHEAERIEWTPIDAVRELLRAGEVRDGLSLTALLWVLAYELEDSSSVRTSS